MTDQQILCNLILSQFVAGIILDSSDVQRAVPGHTIKKVTSALSVMRDDGRLSFKKSGRSFVYWVELANVDKPAMVRCDPVISPPVYRSTHHKAASAIIHSWAFTCAFFVPWIVMFGMMVN